MTVLGERRSAEYRLIRRLALLGLLLGTILVVVMVIVATSAASSAEPPITESSSIAGLVFVTVERLANETGGSSVSMSLGWGSVLSLILFPLLGGLLGWRIGSRKSTPELAPE